MRLRGFGDSNRPPSQRGFRLLEVADQRTALRTLRDMTQPFTADPVVNEIALLATGVCESRQDLCELNAIFDLVKNGRPDIPGFERGLKYVADPNWADTFRTPRRIIENLQAGINGGDCDDHAALICALGGSIGFTMGFLGYGPPGSEELTHVLAVAKIPKRLDGEIQLVGLDTTVSEATLGWLPPYIHKPNAQGLRAKTLLAWLQ